MTETLKQKAKQEVALKIIKLNRQLEGTYKDFEYLENTAIEQTLRVVFLWADKKEKETGKEQKDLITKCFPNRLTKNESNTRIFILGIAKGKLELLRDLKQKTKE
jgi:hypothetical protein